MLNNERDIRKEIISFLKLSKAVLLIKLYKMDIIASMSNEELLDKFARIMDKYFPGYYDFTKEQIYLINNLPSLIKESIPSSEESVLEIKKDQPKKK